MCMSKYMYICQKKYPGNSMHESQLWHSNRPVRMSLAIFGSESRAPHSARPLCPQCRLSPSATPPKASELELLSPNCWDSWV